jgi:hypothetical protein
MMLNIMRLTIAVIALHIGLFRDAPRANRTFHLLGAAMRRQEKIDALDD